MFSSCPENPNKLQLVSEQADGFSVPAKSRFGLIVPAAAQPHLESPLVHIFSLTLSFRWFILLALFSCLCLARCILILFGFRGLHSHLPGVQVGHASGFAALRLRRKTTSRMMGL